MVLFLVPSSLPVISVTWFITQPHERLCWRSECSNHGQGWDSGSCLGFATREKSTVELLAELILFFFFGDLTAVEGFGRWSVCIMYCAFLAWSFSACLCLSVFVEVWVCFLLLLWVFVVFFGGGLVLFWLVVFFGRRNSVSLKK